MSFLSYISLQAQYLRFLRVERNFSWSAAARELGRTPQQCVSCYSAGMYSNFGLLFSQQHQQERQDLIKGSGNVDFKSQFISGFRSRTWDTDEDALLLQHYATYGNKWKQIGSLIHRPGSQVQSNIAPVKCMTP